MLNAQLSPYSKNMYACPPRAEHGFGALGSPPKAVRRAILGPAVRFGLYDAAGGHPLGRPVHQNLADCVASDLEHRPLVKRSRQLTSGEQL